MNVSPMRPIACESEEYIDRTPRSCSTSSAAIVSARMRLSANATSSGTPGLRWWQTMSMSRCSSSVLTVYGRVGLVDDGSTLGSAAMRMMSGAWPPPAPSVWKVWIVRPAIAAIVSSTKPASLRVSVWMASWTSSSSATRRLASMTAGVVPQSSWSLSPQAPARTCSRSASGRLALPLPKTPQLTGSASAAWSIRPMFQGPGVTVVALVPSLGPVPPPRSVVMPLDSAAHTCCGRDHVDVGVDAAGGRDAALARDDLRARADDQVGMDAVHDVRVAGLADGRRSARHARRYPP